MAASLRAMSPEESRKDAKRDAILAAAMPVFLREGYAAASMDEVAREASVAKQTLYSHFGSKDALFSALIRQMCDQFVSPVTLAEIADRPPTEVLALVGHRLLEGVLSPMALALQRVVVSEATRFPGAWSRFLPLRSDPRARQAERLPWRGVGKGHPRYR